MAVTSNTTSRTRARYSSRSSIRTRHPRRLRRRVSSAATRRPSTTRTRSSSSPGRRSWPPAASPARSPAEGAPCTVKAKANVNVPPGARQDLQDQGQSKANGSAGEDDQDQDQVQEEAAQEDQARARGGQDGEGDARDYADHQRRHRDDPEEGQPQAITGSFWPRLGRDSSSSSIASSTSLAMSGPRPAGAPVEPEVRPREGRAVHPQPRGPCPRHRARGAPGVTIYEGVAAAIEPADALRTAGGDRSQAIVRRGCGRPRHSLGVHPCRLPESARAGPRCRSQRCGGLDRHVRRGRETGSS